jgi:succinate-semialdehyde dehydrogenase/glutarate-semialdehyde dehydrogenase
MRHETFGPILAVRRVADESEAVRLANDSYYGLTASVWTADRRRAARIASAFETGTVTVNDHLMSHGMPETPWGGYKQSGIGRSHGELGFHEMTQPKVVVDERFPWMKKNMWWHPYDRDVYRGLLSALVAVYGRGPLRRVRAALRMAGLFLARAVGRG